MKADIDKRLAKEWEKGIDFLREEFIKGKSMDLEKDEKQAQCLFFILDLGKKDMDEIWERSWFTSALFNQAELLHDMVKVYDPSKDFRVKVERLISHCKQIVASEGEKRAKMKRSVQKIMEKNHNDRINVNTDRLIQNYEREASEQKASRTITISEFISDPGPDLLWHDNRTAPEANGRQPETDRRPERSTPQKLTPPPGKTTLQDISDNKGVRIYTQQELEKIIASFRQELKAKEERKRKTQLRQLAVTLVTSFILISAGGYFIYQHYSKLAVPKVEQFAANPSEIEGAYTLIHTIGESRDKMPMQAAIKHQGGNTYKLALMSEYDPEYYELEIRNNGSVHCPVLGDGKLIPNHAGMIIIQLTKGNESWKLMK